MPTTTLVRMPLTTMAHSTDSTTGLGSKESAVFANDPLEVGSKTQELILDIRKRKGLKVEMPVLSDYEDKL